jgi:hypothetical protein
MNRCVSAAAFAALLAAMGSAPAGAADNATEALLSCADESDDARRLRCFDAVVAGWRNAPAAPATAAAASAAPPPAATPAAASAAPTPEAKFGARGDIKPDSHEELQELVATVTAVGAKPHGEIIVTLDNGQVWAEIAASSRIKVKTGETVKIRRGALGSFWLVAPNGRSGKVTRIR